MKLPNDFDKRQELLQITTEYLNNNNNNNKKLKLNQFSKWIPINKIKNIYHLFRLPKSDMTQFINNNNVSKINTFYVRSDL